MTELTIDMAEVKYQIKSYEPGRVTINKEDHRSSVIISPDRLITDWPVKGIEDLSVKTLGPIVQLQPSILLLGTGESMKPIPAELATHLFNQRIGVEVMTNLSACRTYAVITSEGRSVVCALLI